MVIKMSVSSARVLFNYLLVMLFFTNYTPTAESGEQEREHILASYARLQSAENDFQRHHLLGQLSTIEELDYRAYITRLRKKFHQDCVELVQADIAALNGQAPCPSVLPKDLGVVVIDQQHERTRSEHTTILANELDTALGEFDDMLLREQERVKAATPPSAASMAGGEQSGGRAGATAATAEGESGETPSATAVTGSATTSSGIEVDGDSSPSREAGIHGQQQVSGAPSDIPDGSDDDVVARQLREAAEKETDPELKKRLWEEYRKYKQGTD